MRNYRDFFKGKRLTLMGLGLLGRGVGDARFLAEAGAELVVTDLKNENELSESLGQLKEFTNITFRLGGHDLKDFKDRDLIVKAAGVPLDSAYIKEARKNNIPVRMSADLFAELADIWLVGITGTRGKSTVTQLVYEILCKAREKQRVHLGGNVRGISTLSLLEKVRPGKASDGDIAVLELDSWQLQGFGEAKISPHIGIFTNFMPDHMNYYNGNMERYFDDKANIFKYQISEDVLVVGDDELASRINSDANLAPLVISASRNIPEQWHFEDWKLQIPGEHNRKHVVCAGLAVHEFLGYTAEITKVIKEISEQFKGVPGRLEFLREHKGIKIYNDNNATTPEATIAALQALDTGKKNIILIMGGADKGLDMSELLNKIPTYCKKALVLAGTGTDRVKNDIQNTSIYRSISEAVQEAFATAAPGDVVLFSPAFASFGIFKNEYDRNDQFVKAVQALS